MVRDHFRIAFAWSCIVAANAVFTATVSAAALGFNFSAPGDYQDNGASLAVTGFRFQVTSPLTVSGLAAFDPSAPQGTASGQTVGLWDDSRALLAQATVPANTLPMDGTYFSQADITPIILQPGIYRVADTGYRTFMVSGNVEDFPGYSSLPELTYLSSAYSQSGTGFSFPNFTDSLAPLNANIVVAVPEATSLAIVVSGALGMLAQRRRAGRERIGA